MLLLILDDFHTNVPEKYRNGFPWHPHRGIETITYVLNGQVEHGDNMGNRGVIGPGDAQWMTAGSGIVHQEMPNGDENKMLWGFQLWANLPAKNKMMTPRYQEISRKQIPLVNHESGAEIKIICGTVDGVTGPVQDIIIDPEYLDISLTANTEFTRTFKPDYTVMAYIISGSGLFGNVDSEPVFNEQLVLYDAGDEIRILTPKEAIRFLLISGKPLNEPVAWGGPIVMNTDDQLQQAYEEYRTGTFIK